MNAVAPRAAQRGAECLLGAHSEVRTCTSPWVVRRAHGHTGDASHGSQAHRVRSLRCCILSAHACIGGRKPHGSPVSTNQHTAPIGAVVYVVASLCCAPSGAHMALSLGCLPTQHGAVPQAGEATLRGCGLGGGSDVLPLFASVGRSWPFFPTRAGLSSQSLYLGPTRSKAHARWRSSASPTACQHIAPLCKHCVSGDLAALQAYKLHCTYDIVKVLPGAIRIAVPPPGRCNTRTRFVLAAPAATLRPMEPS